MAATKPVRKNVSKSSRIGLRATPEQEAVLRLAAEISRKSVTEFVIDSACQAAEQALLDQRIFMVSGKTYQEFLGLLDRPPQPNTGLEDLLSKPAPWLG
ncbi:MAG: DUF1778 domain-containing protein [Deltaproteobacteria bacterium]|nr:DUF1778 domain-containing protein [Deltaproteobacteria bacterium]